MDFSEYVKEIKALGREITPDALLGTRAIIAPLISEELLDGVAVSRDIAYGEDPRHRLDVFTEAGNNSAKPVLLFVHGGGFVAGDKHSESSPFYSNIGAWAVNNGFAGVNMTYRLAPEHPWPTGIEDIRAAIEFINAKGKELGLDASKIFLMGQSAGGAHAAGYITHPEIYGNDHHGLAGAIMLSAIYDFDSMPTTEMEEAYLGDNESLYEERSALPGLMESDIPLLVTIAEYDPPKFQAQGLQLINEWWQNCEDDESLPQFIYLLGQNHLSVALYLGLDDDQLAPQLKRFINENC